MRISFGGVSRKVVLLVAVGAALVTSGLFAVGTAAANDCDDNAIMKCGANSPSEFITKVNDNAPGDLKAVYQDYGLLPTQYSKFVSSAKMGTAYKDGRIVVDGQTVGHASQSIGRQQIKGNTQKVTINGKTYWGGSNNATFATDSIPVMVLFNDKGVMQFAVLTNCGNPETITPVTPSYSCDSLQKTPVKGQTNTYNFTTKASAANGAKVDHVVYDFGDGQSATAQSLTQAVTHTFTKSSTVKVTVYVKVPGGSTVTTTSIHCQTVITVTPPQQPYAECTNLTPSIIDKSTYTYKFTANANYGGGVKFTGADFVFSDNSGVTMPGMVSGTTATISHSFKDGNSYTATATLHFTNPDGTSQNINCQTNVSPTQVCQPGQTGSYPNCTTPTPPAPTSLIKTGGVGSGATIAAIFGGTSILGAAGHFFIRRRLLMQ